MQPPSCLGTRPKWSRIAPPGSRGRATAVALRRPRLRRRSQLRQRPATGATERFLGTGGLPLDRTSESKDDPWNKIVSIVRGPAAVRYSESNG